MSICRATFDARRATAHAREPFTSYPPAGIKNAIDNGTAKVLRPLEVIETDLVAAAYEGQGVSRITLDAHVTGI